MTEKNKDTLLEELIALSHHLGEEQRELLIIGEAANHLSPQFRNKHPEIPWAVFIGFRNVLAHEYGESLLTRVWLAATESVPDLLAALNKLLADNP